MIYQCNVDRTYVIYKLAHFYVYNGIRTHTSAIYIKLLYVHVLQSICVCMRSSADGTLNVQYEKLKAISLAS